MKTRFPLRVLLALTGGALFVTGPALAATLYWDSNGTGTAGAGATPTGTWGTDAFWTTDSTGANVGSPTLTAATTSVDDLFFSAGTDAVNAYTISLNGVQNARLVTFEDGTATLSSGTLNLGNGGGITVSSSAVTGATISSNLTISGSQSFNVAAGEVLTLSTGTFTRNAGSTLNISSTGTVTTTMTGLDSGSLVNGIIGPWASYGSGASTRYATIDGSNNIVAYTGGTAAATAANVTSTLGTLNYDVAAVGTLGAGASINTLRYTGAAGTIAGALITNGIMNVSGNALTFSGAITGGAGGLVINAANGSISFSSTMNNGGNMLTVDGSGSTTINGLVSGAGGLTKNGSGQLHLNYGAGGNPTYGGPTILNGGILRLGGGGSGGNLSGLPTGNITVNGGIFDIYWGDTFQRALGTGTSQIQITGGVSGFSQVGSTTQTLNIKFGNTNTPIVWGDPLFNPTALVLNSANGTGNVDFQNYLNLSGADRTIQADKTFVNGTATLSGVISNTIGTAGLIKTGVGNLLLSNTNTYNGNTTVSQGGLTAATTGALPGWNSTGKISVASGAVLGVRGGASWTQANIDTLISNVSWADSTSALGFDTTSANFTYSSAVSGNISIVKYGSANTLTLNSDLTGLGGSLILVDGTIARSAGGNLVTTLIEVQNGTISANIGGTTAVTKTTAGVVTLSGSNTYSGGFTINAGTVSGIGSGTYTGFGSGTFTAANGTLSFNGGSTQTINNDLSWGGGNLTLTRSNGATPVTTWTGALTLTDNQTLTLGASTTANSSTFSGNISGGFGLTVTGPTAGASLTLSGANNTFSGGLTLSSSNVTLNINSATALGTGTFTVGAAGTINNTSGSAITLTTNNVQNWNSNFAFTGSNDLNLGTGAVTISGTRTVTVNGGKLTVGGNISGEFGFVKAGAGTLTLNGTGSTFATNAIASISITGGTLEVAKLSDRGAASSIGNANNDYSLRIGNGTALRYIGTGDSTNYRLQYAGGGTATIESSGSGALNFTSTLGLGSFSGNTAQTLVLGGTNTGDNTFNPLVGNNGTGVVSLTKQGAGKWILTNANTYTGDTTVSEGILQIGDGVSSTAGTIGNNSNVSIALGAVLSMNRYFLNGTTSAADAYVHTGQFSGSGTVRVESNARFDFNTNNQTNGENLTYDVNGILGVRSGISVEMGELTGSGLVQRGGPAGAGQSVIIGAKNTSTTFSGAIGSDTNVEKVGSGILTLTGTNGYTGTTTVTAGSLAVNGSLTATSSVTVASGGTLQGSGTINSSVSIQGGGTLAAGNSIDSLATGSLTLAAAAIFAYEMNNDAAAGVAGDLTAVTGNLSIANTTTILNLAELGVGSWTAGDKLTLIAYSGTWNNGLFSYSSSTLNDGATITFSGMDWVFDYNDTSAGTNYTGDLTGMTSYVTMTAIPEPSVTLLGGLAVLGLLLRRRR